MAYVYILQSKRNQRFYIGSTNDLARRLKEHNTGKHHMSKRLQPLKLIFQQEYQDIADARKIEMKLKKLKRKDYILKIIQDGKIRMRTD